MASKLTTCFLGRNFCGYSCEHPRSVLYASTSYRLPPAACKMRHSNSSSQHKRKQIKKSSLQQPQMNADLHTNRNEDLEQQNMPIDDLSLLKKEAKAHGSGENDVPISHADEADSSTALEKPAISSGSVENCVPVTHVDEADGSTVIEIPAIISGTAQNGVPATHVDEAIEIDEAKHLSGVEVEDLLSMVKNAEKNILLLNQARVRALEDLDKILAEKQALQGEINALEMTLAETDARIGVTSEETIHVELLKDELEKLRNELNDRGTAERRESLPYDNQNGLLNDYTSPTHRGTADTLTNELSSLREENASLKCDVESLRSELTQVRSMNKRVEILEKERSLLESDVKELESKLAVSQEDVLKLSALQEECKDLWDKVGNLQNLLNKATNQADQAFTMLQQNQELRKKVDKLEESLEEANAYRLSSEKIQHYNELMQQKISLLEDHLQTSDEEINSYVQLYQGSVKEFQQTLDTLKEESHRRVQDKPVDDMPWDFWSNLLIQIDGWLLGKKISMDDSKILRDMVWKRDGQVRDAYFACKDKSENEVVNTFLKLISSPTGPGLYVVHIAAEMAPVAKVGGLGDVVTGLGKALQRKGHLIEIVLPKYDCMQYEHINDLRALDVVIESYFDGRLFKNKIWAGTVEGLPVYFIEPHHPDKFFWRKQIYGEYDDFRRFSFFSRAALEFLLHAGKKPDIIHCHDWQTAFVAPLYWDVYAPKGLNSARICFTCHNFEYQGTTPASEIASCGLDVHQFNRPDRMQDNAAHDRVNPVKGGVVFSNIVTTVSPTYAQEVCTAEGGRGLHSTLNFHAKKFVGILNGVDVDAWNPATDKFLKVQYTATDFQGKAENKESLRRKLGLSSTDIQKPLVGCITRLVPQKGVHLIRHAIYRTLELGGQFVLLGSSPVHHIQREFEGIANSFQNHDHIRLILKYDDALSHCIYAASDMFIIPSIFEPCGLTQMIAMRYGSIPIARKTGGINDSVFDVDDDTIPPQFRNGFTFLTPDEQGLNGALDRAFNLYVNEPERWHELVQNDMKIDFSWESPSTQYVELYSKSVARARAATRI